MAAKLPPPEGYCLISYDPAGLPAHMKVVRIEGLELGKGDHQVPTPIAHSLISDYPENFKLVAGKIDGPGPKIPGRRAA